MRKTFKPKLTDAACVLACALAYALSCVGFKLRASPLLAKLLKIFYLFREPISLSVWGATFK